MTAAKLRSRVRQVVDQVVELVHPEQVILFGSAVTGHVDDDSDLDFLVVVREGQLTDEVTDQLNVNVQNRPMPCDFVVVTQRSLNRNKGNPGLIYGEILDHGKEVYAA